MLNAGKADVQYRENIVEGYNWQGAGLINPAGVRNQKRLRGRSGKLGTKIFVVFS